MRIIFEFYKKKRWLIVYHTDEEYKWLKKSKFSKYLDVMTYQGYRSYCFVNDNDFVHNPFKKIKSSLSINKLQNIMLKYDEEAKTMMDKCKEMGDDKIKVYYVNVI